MHNGQSLDHHHHQSPPHSASGSGSRQAIPDPESDYQSDDEHDTSSRIGAGGKRKRPISVSYVQVIYSVLLERFVHPQLSRGPAHAFILLLPITSTSIGAHCSLVASLRWQLL